MPTPLDDFFTELVLDSKWSYLERASGPDLGYSLSLNPGNFTGHVKPESKNDVVANITRLIQDTVHENYVVETKLTASGVNQVGHESGLLIVEDNTTFIYFVKSWQSSGSKLRVYKSIGGPITLVDEIDFSDDTNIDLRIEKFAGDFKLFYKQAEDDEYTQTPTVIDASAFGFGAGTSRYVGLGATAGDGGATTFDFLSDFFFFRRLQSIIVNGDSLLRIVNTKITNGDVLLVVKNYNPVSDFEVKQHFEIPTNTLVWANPSDPGYIKTLIRRKTNGYPKTETDGTLVLDTAALETFDDGPIQGRARQFYSAFAVYADKTTFAAESATMPVFTNLYQNIGRRFSRGYKSVVWSVLYSFSKVIQFLVDTDIKEAWAQFNINTATGFFLELWGKIFGTRRYPGETDHTYSDRVIATVILPKTVTDTIIAEVLKITGVVFCEIIDSTRGGMYIGHSYIGFDAPNEIESKGDLIMALAYDNPFFFTVRVRIKQGTNLDQIIKTVQDTRAGGTRFVVEVLEVLP